MCVQFRSSPSSVLTLLCVCLRIQVCIPLVLQDKLQLAEAFVSDYQDLQNRLVRLLDSWCSPGFDPSHLLRCGHGTDFLN